MSDILAPNEVAAINHIPPELLGEIFVRCLPTDSTSQDTQRLLSSVCRLWYTIVLVTPALWASLDIRCNFDVPRPPLPVIRTHLQRSQGHPLSFVLRTADESYHPNDNPNFLAVLTALAAARERWHHVHITLVNMAQNIADLITLGDTPLLQSIQCDVRQRSPSILIRMLHSCPRLESFQWDSLGLLLLPLVETRLTSLSLPRTSLSVFKCTTILRLSPHLSSAVFNVLNSPSPPATPHLTHLTLCTLIVAGNHSTMLLDALTLPALLDLGIRLTKWDATLSAFLTRGKPTLHRLSLAMNYGHDYQPALLRILDLTPHLRTLRLSRFPLHHPPFTATLIRALHPSPPPCTPLCPALQRLELLGISDCPDGLCSAMLRARWGADAHANGVACLESAYIEFEGGVHDCDMADRAELRAEGMLGKMSWGRPARPMRIVG